MKGSVIIMSVMIVTVTSEIMKTTQFTADDNHVLVNASWPGASEKNTGLCNKHSRREDYAKTQRIKNF